MDIEALNEKSKKANSQGRGRRKLFKKFFSRRTGIFVVCLTLALILWLLNALSDTYTSRIKVNINYHNLPQDRVLVQPLQDRLFLTVRAVGFQFLWEGMNILRKDISINFNDYGSRDKIPSAELVSDISSQVSSEYNILDIYPDTLYFRFDRKFSKKVPVKLVSTITYEKQFFPFDSINLIPDSVTIFGPKAVIDTVNAWFTEQIELKELNKSISRQVKLRTPKQSHLNLSTASVEMNIPVEQFTESKLSVEVSKLNEPKELEVVLLPNHVTLTFLVPLSKFDKTTEDMFEAVADFANFDLLANQKIQVKVIQSPLYVRNITASPEYVSYIIYK